MVRRTALVLAAAVLIVLGAQAAPQSAQNMPEGANSPAEARALGYMHTVFGAEREYKKKHGTYAKTLAALVGNGSMTRRMATNDRGDYTVHFSSTGQGFSLGMVPKTFDADHRAFFMTDNGTVRYETDKPAGSQSTPLK
jgi:hypothetical protein